MIPETMRLRIADNNARNWLTFALVAAAAVFVEHGLDVAMVAYRVFAPGRRRDRPGLARRGGRRLELGRGAVQLVAA